MAGIRGTTGVRRISLVELAVRPSPRLAGEVLMESGNTKV